MSEKYWGCSDKMSEANFSPAETLNEDLYNEEADEMPHNTPFHQVPQCLLRAKIFRENLQFYLEILHWDPFLYN